MSTAYLDVVQGAPTAAKHSKVLELYREWMAQHEKKRVFVRQDEIVSYQTTLNAFIVKVEVAIASIRKEGLLGLGSLRYKDSIAALEMLLGHAKRKREFFDGRWVAMARESNTFGHKMTFDEQHMVPQTKDFGSITAKIREIGTNEQGIDKLTPSQAWALVAANMRGELNEWANWERAVKRLQEFNGKWHTTYGVLDLGKTLRYMADKTRIATQYRLEQAPGAQQAIQGAVPLYKLLMQSGFKNVWETGVSQASDDLSRRGAVEEQMGYSSPLRRVSGTPWNFNDSSGKFEARKRGTAPEMPRYAGTIGSTQESGVALRYGGSYIVWKDSIRNRITWTPGDSWNMGAEGPQSVKNYVSLEHPEVIFVHADERLLRAFMAEATGQDTQWLNTQKAKPDFAGGAYIETQIHGDLTWSDVAEVVLDPKIPNLNAIRTDFDTFKQSKHYTFTVRTRQT